MISLGRGVCGDYHQAAGREWLETNGRGGYAMGTVAGGNTRRYHSLLTAPLRPPVGRFQLVNRVEESAVVHGVRFPFSCQAYPGSVYPKGFENLESFRLDPFPVWTFAAADARVEKSFFLRYGEDTAVLLYRHLSGPDLLLDARPLLTCRDHHGAVREDSRFDGEWDVSANALALRAPGAPEVWMCSDQAIFARDGFWYRNQEYAWEQARGLDFREDAFSPGVFRFELKAGQEAALVFSTKERRSGEAGAWSENERRLRRQVLDRSIVRGPLSDALVLASDQFIVEREGGASVIAGYPWFEDWSRDAMVSLPGLCLATGRAEEAGEILETFARHLKDGLLPNRFPDSGRAVEYNAVDAPLWFVWAVQKYYKATQDLAVVRRLLPAMRQVADAYQHGTAHGIRMEQDGLILAGGAGEALTWMDARVDGRPVTPRSGKPVEVQALWYNALQFLAELEIKLGEPARGYDKLAAIARASFNEKFWNAEAGYLFDRIEGRERDTSIRPNALFAISLPYEILEESRFRAVVDAAERQLHAACGLRTLAPGDPYFRSAYEGAPEERDAAYHQGAVWAWLLGAFLTAYVKAHGASDETKGKLGEYLAPLFEHLSEAGLGTVSELFDAHLPHAPRGCPAQAWSVAEALRVIWEESLVV